MYQKYLHFALFLITWPKYLRCEDDAGWIANCKAGFNISSLQCANGVWFDQDVEPGCVCVKGLWVLNSKHCDNNDLLLFGNGDCFSVDKRIRKITYLGYPFAAFAPATLISEKNKNWVFQTTADLSLGSNQPVRIIRINPKTHFYYQLPSESKVCIDKAFKNATLSVSSLVSYILGDLTLNHVSVIKLSRSSPFLQFSTEDPHHTQCTLQSLQLESGKHLSFQKFQLTPGQGIYLGAEKVVSSDGNCSNSCQIHRREKRFLPDPTLDVTGYYGFSLSADNSLNLNTIQRYIREQNVRIIKSELNYMKNLQSPPELRLNDSTYILVERRENNLYGKLDPVESEHAQVMTVLQSCYNQSNAYEFIIEYINASDGYCKYDHISSPRDPDHPKEFIAPYHYICNCTKEYKGVAFNSTVNNTCNAATPLEDQYMWKYPTRDFVVEAMWKTFQFTHFQCAKYFEVDGRAASVFHEKLERLFHADVIFRWFNPGRTSQKLWEYIFMGYNLKQYTMAMDMCLCAAQYWSDYPQPMVRPVIPVFKKKRSLRFGMDGAHNDIVEESNLNAQCLQHPWDPVQDMNGHSC